MGLTFAVRLWQNWHTLTIHASRKKSPIAISSHGCAPSVGVI
jgi:hypothetical protein